MSEPDRTDAAKLTIEIVGAIAGLTTLVAAFLFYFGWARTSALYTYFGVTQDLLDFSTRDYLLRSVNSAIRPLGLVLVLAAVCVPVYRRIAAGPIGAAILRYAGWLFVVIGALLMFIVRPFGTDWPVAAVVLLVGLVLTLVRMGPPERTDTGRLQLGSTLERVALAALVIFMCFWSIAGYAAYRGNRDGMRLVSDPARTSAVTVYSVDDLDIEADGVIVTPVTDSKSPYRFRYDHLRVLVRTGGRYLLLSDGWQQGQPIIVLPEGDKLRFEYRGT